MLNRQRGRTFPLVIALAMALSLLLAPLGHAAIQDPAAFNSNMHHGASAQGAADHGHSHDADWPDGGDTEAPHSHHAGDHSHEVPAAAEAIGWPLVCPKDRLCTPPAASPPQVPASRVDRPPRS